MATLTADVTAEATSWNVSAMPGVNFLQVDDEIVRVLDERSTELRLRVERGYAGTTAATHDSGADLVPVYVPSTGAGAAQTVSRIGPFRVAHDTVGVTGTFGVTVADIPEGAALIRVWCIAVEASDTETQVGYFIHDGVAGQALEGGSTYLDLGGPYGSAHWQIEDNQGAGGAVAPSTRVALATGASAHLSCKFVYSGSPATQGEVDVYALLAESA